jgi:hypothetical protein
LFPYGVDGMSIEEDKYPSPIVWHKSPGNRDIFPSILFIIFSLLSKCTLIAHILLYASFSRNGLPSFQGMIIILSFSVIILAMICCRFFILIYEKLEKFQENSKQIAELSHRLDSHLIRDYMNHQNDQTNHLCN